MEIMKTLIIDNLEMYVEQLNHCILAETKGSNLNLFLFESQWVTKDLHFVRLFAFLQEK